MMEDLAYVMQPYKELVGSIAAIVTIGQMFSGVFLCLDIYKQGDTRGVGIMPFVGGLIMSVLNLQYGYMLRDNTVIQVNFFGLALNIVYLMVYFHFAQNKVKVWGKIGAGIAFCAACITYAQMEDPVVVEDRFGTMITIFMFYLIASPLFHVKDIIKNRSTEGMPFPMIASGTVVTFMWLLYGVILRNKFMVFQNVVAFVLCMAQLSLFVIYPSKPKGMDKAKAKAKKAE